MQPDEIADLYLEREAKANKQPSGANCKAIMEQIARENEITFEEVREAVLHFTIMGPN